MKGGNDMKRVTRVALAGVITLGGLGIGSVANIPLVPNGIFKKLMPLHHTVYQLTQLRQIGQKKNQSL
jgi:hypothetical protein